MTTQEPGGSWAAKARRLPALRMTVGLAHRMAAMALYCPRRSVNTRAISIRHRAPLLKAARCVRRAPVALA
jgi:hypothetical protein